MPAISVDHHVARPIRKGAGRRVRSSQSMAKHHRPQVAAPLMIVPNVIRQDAGTAPLVANEVSTSLIASSTRWRSSTWSLDEGSTAGVYSDRGIVTEE